MTNTLSATGFSIQSGDRKTEFVLHINTSEGRLIESSFWDRSCTICVFGVTKREMYALAQQLIDMGNKMDDIEDADVLS